MNHARVLLIDREVDTQFVLYWRLEGKISRAGSEFFGVQNKNRREAGCGIPDCGIPAGIDTPRIRDLGGMRNRESGAMQERFLFFGTVLAMFQDTAGTNQIDDGRDVGGIDSEFEYIHRL